MGTTQHICYEKESFMYYETCESWQVVFLNDNKTQQIVGLGEVAIKLLDGKAKEILNVLHVFSLLKKHFLPNSLTNLVDKFFIKLGIFIFKNIINEVIT